MKKLALIIIGLVGFIIGLEILIPNILNISPLFYLLRKKLSREGKPQIIYQDAPLLANFTVRVVNAVTKTPVVGAEVRIKRLVFCPQVVGVDCPESDILVNKTNQEGVAKFDTRPLGGRADLYITVKAEGYQTKTVENTEIDELGNVTFLSDVTVELVGGEIAIPSAEEAKLVASSAEKVKAWLGESSEGVNVSARLENQIWIVEYATKRYCQRGEPKTERPCTLNVYIDPQTKEILKVEER